MQTSSLATLLVTALPVATAVSKIPQTNFLQPLVGSQNLYTHRTMVVVVVPLVANRFQEASNSPEHPKIWTRTAEVAVEQVVRRGPPVK